MKAGYKALCVATILLTSSTVAVADAAAPAQLVDRAVKTLQAFLEDESADWIREHVRQARAILIVPSMIKAGFVLGAGGGDGVLTARDPTTGDWSDPAFYQIGGFSVGAQIGGQQSRVILVARTQRGLESLLQTSAKLGAEGSIAVGPVGSGAAMNVTADLVTFAKTRGAFAGISLEGSTVGVHSDFNRAYYGRAVSTRDILIDRIVTNAASTELKTLLDTIR